MLGKDSVFLVGPMGSGKSAVGKYLARLLRTPFCDSDAEIVISAIAAHAHCKAPLVIDRTDLARDGATAILFGETGLRIETVGQDSGDRPWSRGGLAAKM